jgi:hypothetical protein
MREQLNGIRDLDELQAEDKQLKKVIGMGQDIVSSGCGFYLHGIGV